MTDPIVFLCLTAASLGFFHTLLGPDHYLPFILMARARKWGVAKTLWITSLCGFGHIGSSVLIGLIGVLFGLGVTSLTNVESLRGEIAAWALISFGLIYAIWGVRNVLRKETHSHHHVHSDGIIHHHSHNHHEDHLHLHENKKGDSLTPWVLFVLFVLGPCEPLIPLLMYPSATESLWGVVLVTAIFGMTTLITMLMMVFFSLKAFSFLPLKPLERFSHVIAGCVICFSGIGIRFFGL